MTLTHNKHDTNSDIVDSILKFLEVNTTWDKQRELENYIYDIRNEEEEIEN